MPKLFSTRRPSVKKMLGLTSAKRSFSRKTGLGSLKAAMKPEQTIKRKVKKAFGYESSTVKAIRNVGKRRYLFGFIPLWWRK